MKIILMRHGKPAIGYWDKVTSNEMPGWIKHYNESGVEEDFPPDEASVIQSKLCYSVVSSTLKRSKHSAELLGFDSAQWNEIYNEAALPVISIPWLKLKPNTWAILFRVFWLFGYSGKLESRKSIRLRVKKASELLIEYAIKYDSVLLVGHGIMNRLLAKELIDLGWQVETNSEHISEPKRNRSHKYWGYQQFKK